MALRLAIVAAIAALSACAGGPQLQTLHAIPNRITVDAPYVAPPDEEGCVPAAVATMLASAGIVVPARVLQAELYVPVLHGALRVEAVALLRAHGLVPYVLERDVDALIKELAAGHPVMVWQNLGTRGMPDGHSAVVVGYDGARGEFLLYSGFNADLRLGAARFLGTWERAGRWALVVTQPDQPPASASAQRWLRALSEFETTDQGELALAGYRAATQRWPQEALAWGALGTAQLQAGQIADAVVTLETATRLAPQHAGLRDNLNEALRRDQARPPAADFAAVSAKHVPLSFSMAAPDSIPR
jgi:hypothetical protein